MEAAGLFPLVSGKHRTEPEATALTFDILAFAPPEHYRVIRT